MNTTSLISNGVIGALIVATLVVVFLTVYRTMLAAFSYRTAVVLAVGVTILATIGTAQIVFLTPSAKESPPLSLPAGGALVFGFISLAVAELIVNLLVAALGNLPATTPSVREDDGALGQVSPQAVSTNEDMPPAKRHGKWSRQSPELPGQNHPNDLSKPEAPKQPPATGLETPTRQSAAKAVP